MLDGTAGDCHDDSARGQAYSGLKDGLQCLPDRLYATFAGLVLEIVLLEVSLPIRCVQVAAVQQCAADARAVL